MITKRDIKINKIKARLLELRFLKDNMRVSDGLIEELDEGITEILITLDEIMDNPPKSLIVNESPIFP